MKHIKRLNNKQLSSVRTKIQFQRFNELNAMQFFRKYISSHNFKFQSSRDKPPPTISARYFLPPPPRLRDRISPDHFKDYN